MKSDEIWWNLIKSDETPRFWEASRKLSDLSVFGWSNSPVASCAGSMGTLWEGAIGVSTSTFGAGWGKEGQLLHTSGTGYMFKGYGSSGTSPHTSYILHTYFIFGWFWMRSTHWCKHRVQLSISLKRLHLHRMSCRVVETKVLPHLGDLNATDCLVQWKLVWYSYECFTTLHL